MHLHVTKDSEVENYLFLDDLERVATLPTDYIKDLSNSPKKYSYETISLYSRRLDSFCGFLEQHPVFGQVRVDQAITKLKMPLLDEYYHSLNSKGLQSSTVRGHEVVVKGFTDWLTTESAGRIHPKPIYAYRKFRTASPLKRMPKFVTAEEVVKLSQGMHWECQRLVTHVMFDTGIRVSEAVRLLKSEIPSLDDFPAEQQFFPFLIRGGKGRGRTFKERYTIVSRPVLIRINRYFRSKTYLRCDRWPDDKKPAFLNVYGEKLSKPAIQKFIDDATVRAGIDKKHSPHKLRHGTAYSLLKSDGTVTENFLLTQKVLGHANIKTTEIYTNIPAPLLQKLKDSNSQEVRDRIDEAEMVFERTYLSEKSLPKNKSKIGVRK